MPAPISKLSVRQRRSLTLLLAALPSIGPFCIDAYLPALKTIAEEFDVSLGMVQQSLTAYMLPFALMTLWHGAISDSLGRRSVSLYTLAFFVLATICCAFAWNIESLIIFRALQGMTAGAGMVVGRAVVRDLVEGPAAQKMMAMVAMTFAIAPAIAPVIGGWLFVSLGWRSIFSFLALFSAGVWYWAWRTMPETLPPEDRQAFSPAALARSYFLVLRSPAFIALGLSLASAFSGIFLYIVSAPAFLMDHLGVSETGFLWLFGPVTAGMFVGIFISNRLAGVWTHRQTILRAYLIMVLAAAVNAAYHWHFPASIPWSLAPLFLYIVGSSMAMPSVSLVALDLFPERRGTASSCQSFLQSTGNVVVTGLAAPILWSSTLSLAVGQLVLAIIALLSFFVMSFFLIRAEKRTVITPRAV